MEEGLVNLYVANQQSSAPAENAGENTPVQRQQRLFESDVEYYRLKTTEQLKWLVADTNPDAPDINRLSLRNRALATVLESKKLVKRFIRSGCMSKVHPEDKYVI